MLEGQKDDGERRAGASETMALAKVKALSGKGGVDTAPEEMKKISPLSRKGAHG